MKKKNLLLAGIMILSLFMMNQFAYGQKNGQKKDMCKCNCFLPDYGVTTEKCRIKCYLVCEPAYRVVNNPGMQSAIVSFSLKQARNVSLKIFNEKHGLVKTLADTVFEEGEQAIVLNTENLPNGTYFVKMETANFSENKKLVVAK